MLTPQEVSTRAFSKAMMGGYNMAAVDEFLDELTDDYTALYKENATLKAKLKVLVEKVEEYRATEDSMRATLLTAQKMADSIVHEAEQKKEQLLQEAKGLARQQIADSRRPGRSRLWRRLRRRFWQASTRRRRRSRSLRRKRRRCRSRRPLRAPRSPRRSPPAASTWRS